MVDKSLIEGCCRFDLLHIMVDEPDVSMDREVANHIVGVHMRRDTAFNVPYTMPQIQNYIKFARTRKPELSQQVGRIQIHLLPRSVYQLCRTVGGEGHPVLQSRSRCMLVLEWTCVPGALIAAFEQKGCKGRARTV